MTIIDKTRYWRTKKPCGDCGNLIKRQSIRCVKCSGIQHRKTKEDKLKRANSWRKKMMDEYKSKAFNKLGYFCNICGFNDKRALQIDHVNEDGNKERKFSENYMKYKKVFEDKKGRYQVLCANCNFIKSYHRIVKGLQEVDCVRNHS